jgi:hypothetical protein
VKILKSGVVFLGLLNVFLALPANADHDYNYNGGNQDYRQNYNRSYQQNYNQSNYHERQQYQHRRQVIQQNYRQNHQTIRRGRVYQRIRISCENGGQLQQTTNNTFICVYYQRYNRH